MPPCPDPGFRHDFSRIPAHPDPEKERQWRERFRPAQTQPEAGAIAHGPLQAKLEIGAVDDPLEHEADRIADRVIRSASAPSSEARGEPAVTDSLQRKCANCEVEEEKVQRKAADASTKDADAPPRVREVLASPGQPLETTTRAFMEPRFGSDFGDVRIHVGASADASARAIQAHAYTSGRDIVFRNGAYVPEAAEGRRLIAHELAHVVQQRGGQESLRRQAAPPTSAPPVCKTTYKKAGSFLELIDLVRAAETKLAAAGIVTPKEQIHALRGIYYGTTWSLDYSVEKSITRNEGFQRFTRPSEDPAKSIPADVRVALDCGLFEALKDSQDITADPSGRQLDFGHLIIALDARNDPAMSSNIKYPVKTPIMNIDIDLGGTGPELVSWLGDLGGGAASLAIKRVTLPSTNASEVFKGSDYGGPINLEGDIAGYVVGSGSSTTPTTPSFPSGKRLSDALQDYLSPPAPSAAWKNRATTFLKMNGATFDAAGAWTNRAVVISAFAAKIQEFACNYLASRVKDKHVSVATAKAAALHVIPSSQEVSTAFVDALDDSRKSGGKIEATRFPSPTPAGSSACSMQLMAARVLG